MGTAGDVLETTPLSVALRRLWADHVIWTRQYIVAAVAGTPDAEAAAGRLLGNQEDIGNAIVPLYGAEAGEELTRLLKEHILIAVDLVAAAIKGDKRAFARHDKRWDANADDIAAFLAGANPNWPEDDVRDLLAQHLSLTKGEAVARLQQEWAADIATYDDIFTDVLTMADALTDGIVAQFPERFGAAAGEELSRLLKEHILIAFFLVPAPPRGTLFPYTPHFRSWDANADDIAAFLAGANPNWPEDDVRDLLAQHLSLTKGEAVARLQEDWAADVAAFDDIFTEIGRTSGRARDQIWAHVGKR